MPASSDIFLSYPHKEQEAVRALAAALRAEGLTVWMDESNIDAFDHIHDRVASAIAESRAVLAWYSQHYAASRPCQWELTASFLCEDGERILVLNPEPDDKHIQPRSLVNRRYVGADDLSAVARQVKSHVARFTSSIGDNVSFSQQPLHYGRQLTGLNHFVGRNDLFWRLHDALSESSATMLTGTTRSVAQLRGFGGVGKSVLAEEYGLRFGAAYPGGIFWLKAYGNDAGDEVMQPKDRDGERLHQISDFASHLNIPTEGRQPSEIYAALAHVLATGRRSLWIVDDLPSGLKAGDLSKWLSPHASVPTLITTRDRSHSSLGKLIDVDALSHEESFALLESHRDIEESEHQAARELLDTLGHHALAVEITGSYLAEQRSVSLEKFLEELRHPGQDILEQAAELADELPLDHSPSIVATLKGTISQLSEPARDLLCLASYIAVAPIPKELVEAVFARLNETESAAFERMKAAKETGRFALSRKEPTPADALSVHTLVARTARRHPASKERADKIRAAAVASLSDMLRQMFSPASILRQSLTITHARALASPLTTAEEALLLVLVANTDLGRGDLETADRLARRALDYCQTKLGESALETSCARSGVAMVLLARGDNDAAREILEAIAPVFERSLPPGDAFRIGAQLGLAHATAAQGDLSSACRIAEAALSDCADSRGADHPLTLSAKTLTAHLLVARGNLQDAASLQQEVLAARRRMADSQDLDTLTDEFFMAQGRIASGDMESVSPIIEKASEVFEQAFGENNVLTLGSKLSLLLLLMKRGDASGARQLAGEIVPRFEQMFGPNNPATLRCRFAEAVALLCDGESAAAQSLLESVISELEAVLGAEHAEVLQAKCCLAQALHENGDHDGARRILSILIPVAEARLGLAHALTLSAKTCLAWCLLAQDDKVGTCKVWEEVAAIYEESLGSDHPNALSAKLSWAQSLAWLEQYERCNELLHQIIPLAESRLGAEHWITQTSKECLAISHNGMRLRDM
jgi:tetratricopeptide (TPR) repeat protein